MARAAHIWATLALLVFLAGCKRERAKAGPLRQPSVLAGGATTVSFRPLASLSRPAANLDAKAKARFYAGRALARQPWVRAPSITNARDGLGPLYNARSCLGCHPKGGRGALPKRPDKGLFAAALRLGRQPPKGRAPSPVEAAGLLHHGVVGDPRYGHQIQTQSTALVHIVGAHDVKEAASRPSGGAARLHPEAKVKIRWATKRFRYPSGETVILRRPEVVLHELAYGALDAATKLSLRVAPPIHGLGLLGAVSEADIRAKADPQDRDGDGISGRPNLVWKGDGKAKGLGRYGWKAHRFSLRIQVAAALQGDMGITNPVFRGQPCTERQEACRDSVSGAGADGLEISEKLLALMVAYVRDIGVPRRRAASNKVVRQGEALFLSTGCASCHRPSFVTNKDADPKHLAGQTIWPYTDLLLHDMGERLADHRPEFEATGREWRTPPLWSLGLSRAVNGNTSYLHDGRASSVEAAILWHGGEAAAARERFVKLDKTKRHALISFVRSL